MTSKTFRVLLIEDSPSDAHLVEQALKESLVPSFILTHVTRLEDGLEKLLREHFDLAVLDLALPDSHGLETFFTVRDHAPEVPIVILTGLVGDDMALQAFQEGAADCLPKTYLFNRELARSLHYAIERTRLQPARQEVGAARRDAENTPGLFGFLNRPTQTIGASVGATVERKSVAALQASEVSYRRLFESAQDGILILESEAGRITDVNPFLINLLGYSREEIIGQTVGELSPFKDHVANHAMLSQLQAEGYVRYEHLPLKTKNGRPVDVEFVSNEYKAGGQSVIQCNIRDITQRRRLEEKIDRAARELEERVAARTADLQALNQELEAFSYSVSHDLRAPLRHITGFAGLLRKGAGESLSKKNLQYLITITESAERMGELIDNLLAFSRVGRMELQKTEFDLAALVKETVDGFATETEERNIVWEIGALPSVWADPVLLRLVLVNLLSNAVKFTSTRAEARIEIGCVPDDTGEATIFIRDNGVGFDPQYAKKLFGVFQRLHSSEEFEGTGIGLANVQRIILRHGGKITGQGTVDGGATFTFSLPAKAPRGKVMHNARNHQTATRVEV